jgi:hypothetical protein
LAAGLRSLPKVSGAFAQTQAAWRFYHNPRISLLQLAQPLRQAARCALEEERSEQPEHASEYAPDHAPEYASEYAPGHAPEHAPAHVLVVHDWSKLHYKTHASKTDRTSLSQSQDWGYELQTALLISARDGRPIAPVAQTLRSAAGLHSSFQLGVQPGGAPLDGLDPLMQSAEDLATEQSAMEQSAMEQSATEQSATEQSATEQSATERPVVHIIDAQADSVAHYRRWHAAGRLFLVRADAQPRVRHEGVRLRLEAVAELLARRGEFVTAREVRYQGRRAWQQVAQTSVVLDRPARPQRPQRPQRPKSQPGPRKNVPGPPLTLRLVVSRVFDAAGTLLAQWLLLTNLPGEGPTGEGPTGEGPTGVSAAQVALWYYWRWQIESYFKLLKTAGHCLEQWQQTSAEAVFRRLLIAGMACVVVWQLARAEGPAAEDVRQVLVHLSGRQMKHQMKHKVPFTEPALLAGLWTLLTTLSVLEQYDVETLRQLAQSIRPTSHSSPKHDV